MALSGWAKTRELLYSEHLEVIPIAYPCIQPAAVFEEFEVGIYLGHTQRYTYNGSISHLTL